MIHSIYISNAHGGSQLSVESAELVASKGIVGDRNFEKSTWPGQNLTLVQLEKIEGFCRAHAIGFDASLTRRNIITQGIELNHLVGKRFRIGDTVLTGVELCEPCADLGKQLATKTHSAPALVRALVSNAGLRANVDVGGTIAVGMTLQEIDSFIDANAMDSHP